MANKAKAKGTLFETEVVRVLVAAGLPAVKPRQTGRYDVGDIHLDADITMQAKAWKNIASALREGTAGAQLQAVHARRPIGVSVIKKPGGAIADAYVAMPLHVFIDLIRSRETPGVRQS